MQTNSSWDLNHGDFLPSALSYTPLSCSEYVKGQRMFTKVKVTSQLWSSPPPDDLATTLKLYERTHSNMDPVTAVGVASAAIQFTDFSIKAFSLYQQIRNSKDAATERDQQLEQQIKEAQMIRKDPRLAMSGAVASPDPIDEATRRCTQTGSQLLQALQYVRGIDEDITSFRATIRVLKKNKTMSKLHSSLEADEKALARLLNERISRSIDHLDRNLIRELTGLNHLSQEVLKLLSKQIQVLEDQEKIRKRDHKALSEKVDATQKLLQSGFGEAERLQRHEKFLETLFFPEMEQRQAEIKHPAPDTFEWLFQDEQQAETSRPENLPEWSNFRNWLREDSSTYWISGKAGSGKSTLMASIVSDYRTIEELQAWSQTHQLQALSYFFWRAGATLQQSVVGLLRSLLYQLCENRLSVTEAVLSESRPHARIGSSWTERTLLQFIKKVIQASGDARFCIFIDGLDEFTGDYYDLLNCIFELHDLSHIKFCVSSRPQSQFKQKFEKAPQLRLEDLNRHDIELFVSQALSTTELDERFRNSLTEKITERSEGMFLWAALVTKSLLSGLSDRDSHEILLKRLEAKPKELEKLFQQMVDSVQNVHLESFAIYLHLMKLWAKIHPDYDDSDDSDDSSLHFASIPLITILFLDAPISCYEDFSRQCELNETRVIARSAGLLEVKERREYKDREAVWNNASTQFKFVAVEPRFSSEHVQRRQCAGSEPYPLMLDYELKYVGWIHRSAFDYFTDHYGNDKSFAITEDDETLLNRIGSCWVNYLAAAPSYGDQSRHRSTYSSFQSLIAWIEKCYANHPVMASTLLDKIMLVVSHFDPCDIGTALPRDMGSYKLYNWPTEKRDGAFLFWALCSKRCSLHGYISCRMEHFLPRQASCAWIVYCLCLLLTTMRDDWVQIRGSWHRSTTAERLHHVTDLDSYREITIPLIQTLVQKLTTSFTPEDSGSKTYLRCGYSNQPAFGAFNNGVSWKHRDIQGPISLDLPLVGALAFVVQVLAPVDREVMRLLNSTKLEKPLCDIHENWIRTVSGLILELAVSVDMYCSERNHFNRVLVHAPAKSMHFRYSGLSISEYKQYFDLPDSTEQVLRLICVPIHKEKRGWKTKNVKARVVEFESTQSIEIMTSRAIVEQLVDSDADKYLHKGFSGSGEKRRYETTQRQAAYETLCKEIKSRQQGLDAFQQLFARASIKVSLLGGT
ncbi:hypothetical protein F5Y18DRAFT_422945 [Xylariaceae sp. FL1019]|nr:hypothetical protein F5Y18DRAFT_422945 [Xylariaceae sp. FL1019]